jgi:hypothetical protein
MASRVAGTMRTVGWAFFYMFVVLKIPIAFALYLVWWACREPADADDADIREDGGGGNHPRPRHPGPPRRGPHREVPPQPPARVRANGAQLDREHPVVKRD